MLGKLFRRRNHVTKLPYYIGIIIVIILLLLTLPYAWKILSILFMSPTVSIADQLVLYKWAAVGFVIFAVIHGAFPKNMKWMETFSHELTHIVVALLTFRRIHSFQAGVGNGVVYTSGNNSAYIHAPLSLAPYCLPIFTYLLLSIRSLLTVESLWIYDILIGTSICFHFFCFRNQIGSYQTDINRYPLTFSYLYIITFLLINILIILVAFFPHYNVYTSLWRYLTFLWDEILHLRTILK